MREILFRGKRVDNGEWVEGDIYHCPNASVNINTHKQGQPWLGYSVIPETVGQFTGLTDKIGKKIFEGDIMRFTNPEGDSSIYVIQWMQCSCICGWVARFMSLPDDDGDPLDDFFCSMSEIIGNIHDNPELLKGGAL